MSTGLSVASTIVQVVHDLVRDVISQLVGSAISWAAQFTLSLGLATPWIIGQVTSRVASLAAKVGSKVIALTNSIRALAKLLDQLKALLKQSGDLFATVLRGGKGAAPAPGPTSGGRSKSLRQYLADERRANIAYDAWRSSDADLASIAARNGELELPNGETLTSEQLARIKQHLMRDEHNLAEPGAAPVIRRFDADSEISDAWQTVIDGAARAATASFCCTN